MGVTGSRSRCRVRAAAGSTASTFNATRDLATGASIPTDVTVGSLGAVLGTMMAS